MLTRPSHDVQSTLGMFKVVDSTRARPPMKEFAGMAHSANPLVLCSTTSLSGREGKATADSARPEYPSLLSRGKKCCVRLSVFLEVTKGTRAQRGRPMALPLLS
jgi:hypothetical protein